MMNNYFKMPLKYNAITQFYQKGHLAIDLGWSSTYGGSNPPIYSSSDGIVLEKGYNDSTGYRIWIQTDTNDERYLFRYCHLKNAVTLNVGDKIKTGDIIGIMGSTGNSTGNHLHFNVWKCPKNYILNWADNEKYAVNPLDYCYLFEDQISSNETAKYLKKVIGTSIKTERNSKKNQIEILSKYINVRTSPEIKKENILGYINLGIYNVLEEKKDSTYTWYKIKENTWVSNVLDTKYYPSDQNELPDKNDLKKFVALKEGYYYIYLKEKESVYYEVVI